MTVDEIKDAKKKLGWTNSELAFRADLPISTVAKILGGTTKNPRQNSILAMEAAIQEESRPRRCGNEDNNTAPSSLLREPDFIYGSSVKTDAAGSASTQLHRLYTVDDYLALPDDRRVELIDGRFYDMAAPTGIHQIVLFQIWKALDSCIEEHGLSCMAQGAPFDVQLFGDPYTVVQPDVMVFCTKPEEARADRARSAPDFIAEILSPSTAFRDRTQKLCRYRDAGVKEVWIVSPAEQRLWVYRFYDGCETPDEYSFSDSVPLGISDHKCSVDFSKILKLMGKQAAAPL